MSNNYYNLTNNLFFQLYNLWNTSPSVFSCAHHMYYILTIFRRAFHDLNLEFSFQAICLYSLSSFLYTLLNKAWYIGLIDDLMSNRDGNSCVYINAFDFLYIFIYIVDKMPILTQDGMSGI